MEKEELEKLRELPIEAVAERLGLRVSHHKALCPFHDDSHPSLKFKTSKNTCRCYVCMMHPIGPIDLVMQHLRLDFMAACKWLADEHNVILECTKGSVPLCTSAECTPEPTPLCTFDASRYERYFEHPWLNDEARRFLFEERRLDPRVVRWCRLTSWKDKKGVPWLQIPYYNREGQLVGIQNRNLVKGALPRFRFPQGAECGIYNLPVLNLLKPGDQLFITEGASDCWAMLSAGHKAIAIPSATLLTKDVRRKMEEVRCKCDLQFHMYPDRDEPGERLFLELQKVLPSLVHHQLPPDCKDFSEYYLKKITT